MIVRACQLWCHAHMAFGKQVSLTSEAIKCHKGGFSLILDQTVLVFLLVDSLTLQVVNILKAKPVHHIKFSPVFLTGCGSISYLILKWSRLLTLSPRNLNLAVQYAASFLNQRWGNLRRKKGGKEKIHNVCSLSGTTIIQVLRRKLSGLNKQSSFF